LGLLHSWGEGGGQLAVFLIFTSVAAEANGERGKEDSVRQRKVQKQNTTV